MDVDGPKASSSTNPLLYLEQQEAASPAQLKSWWTKIRTSYEKKLWHNLTVVLTQFVFLPETGPYQIDLFDKFITTIESKINALRLVEIARRVGREYTEPELTLKFLESLHSRLTTPYPVPATADSPGTPVPPRPIPEAYALSLSSIAYAQLLLGDLPACKKSLDEVETLLSEQDTVEPVVYAGYYGVAGDYFKVKADYGPYYKNALLYLACVDTETELTEEDRRARAHDLCIAALLGDTIYNFGELLQHPILQSLAGTPNEWIKDLISAFNNGEIGKFESLANHFSSEPILESSLNFLRQKICLMALIQAAFARPKDGSSKLMTFQSIAEATRLPVNEVEHLIMKAFSLHLIRGSLDQVSSTADITWVQPRVLEGGQLDLLAEQFDAWRNGVGETWQEVNMRYQEARAAVTAA
ncbi:putative proteasome regulatory particle subunit [Kockovaella imperatae]|uniref:Putative proteasome regulatory particle subunit n=1 Tax=Kockovaella imperatae TaxID=4999 RepID=A0A1Y1U8C7_9TREE|nr:putative proteasome regulatory particle subunit [Kockovaella imperatae]ORX33766.1 putative proteasome regulatory particle subunit [Kockovaella imperatae]